MTTAYAYLRVSGDEQADRGLPIAGQREAVATYCAEHNLTVLRWFTDEARPGSTDNRAEFQEMMRLAHAEPAPVGAVVLWSWSRFSRDSNDAHFWKASLRRHGLEVRSVAEPVPDNLPAGFEYVLESAIHWSDARRLEEISHDSRRGQQALARAGYVPGGHPVPPGYRVEIVDAELNGKTRRARRWVLDEATTPLVRRAWDLRLAGASYVTIWEETHLYKTPEAYSKLFSATIYRGEWRWGETVIPMPAIVTAEEWAAVNAGRAERRTGTYSRRQGSPYLLSGLAHCARCGGALIGRTTTATRSLGEGATTRRRYTYYQCQRRRGHRCDLPAVSARRLETAVIEALFDVVLTEDTVAQMTEAAADRRRQQEDTMAPQIRRAEEDVARLGASVEQLLVALETSASATITRRLETRESELATAQAALIALRQQATGEEEQSVDLPGLRAILAEALREWDPCRRRALLAIYVDSVVVGVGEAQMRYKFPFALSL